MKESSKLIKHSAPQSRGTLSLAPKDSWVPDPADASHYDILNMSGDNVVGNSFIAKAAQIPYNPLAHGFDNSSLSWGYDSRYVVTRAQSPDSTLTSIFITSLQVTNNSAAKALSTMITILASMAYYDQFLFFAETARDVSTTYLQPFLFPQSFRSFTTVLAIAFAHCLLTFLVVAAFVTSTRSSTLGDHWQTLSQVISPATEDLLGMSNQATDKEVRQYLKAEQREKETAIIQPLVERNGRIGIVARKARRSSSHHH